MKNVFCKLSDPEMQIPIPGSGGQLFSARGETVDKELQFWKRLIDDGDIVETDEPKSAPVDKPQTKAPVAAGKSKGKD